MIRLHRVLMLALIAATLGLSSSAAQTTMSNDERLKQTLEAGHRYMNDGDIEASIAAFTRAIELAPSSAEIYYLRGVAYGIDRDRERAAADYTEALARNPQLTPALFNRADIRLSLKDIAGAINDMDAVLGFEPQNFFALLRRADLQQRQGNIEAAVADYNHVIAINPDPGIVKAAHIAVNSLRGVGIELESVLADYDAALKAHSSQTIEILFRRGYLLQTFEHYDKAIRDFSEIIRLDPRNPFAYHNRGETQRMKGDFGSAIEDFNRALKLKPNLAWSYAARGFARLGMNDTVAAEADFAECLRRDPSLSKDLKARLAEIEQKGRNRATQFRR